MSFSATEKIRSFVTAWRAANRLKLSRVGRLQRRRTIRRGLPAEPAGGAPSLRHRARRHLYHQPAFPEDGSLPRRPPVFADSI